MYHIFNSSLRGKAFHSVSTSGSGSSSTPPNPFLFPYSSLNAHSQHFGFILQYSVSFIFSSFPHLVKSLDMPILFPKSQFPHCFKVRAFISSQLDHDPTLLSLPPSSQPPLHNNLPMLQVCSGYSPCGGMAASHHQQTHSQVGVGMAWMDTVMGKSCPRPRNQ